MTRAEILAYRPKLEGMRKPRGQQPCACGKTMLDYLPIRRSAGITHGAQVCVRYEERK